jgi:cholesterol transport system auxiliary component
LSAKPIRVLATLACASISMLAAGGCSLGGANRVAPKLYDFGVASATETALSAVTLGSVSNAPTLGGTEIRYRYHDDPYQARAYGESRWLAPPAELLANRMVSALSGQANAKQDFAFLSEPTTAPLRLSLDLETFEQVFDGGGGARALLRLIAELHDARTRQTVGRRVLEGERPTPTADAAGAVTALVALADEAIAELMQWLAEEVERLPAPSEPVEDDESDEPGAPRR